MKIIEDTEPLEDINARIRRNGDARLAGLTVIDPPSPPPPPPDEGPRFLRCRNLVKVILSRAGEGFIPHCLGSGGELYRLRLGGVAVLTGAPGTGKTSLSLGIALDHARNRGPVVYVSLEMDADELAARLIGMQCDASWEDVLCGHVKEQHMEHALELPRFVILEGDHANLTELEKTVNEVRTEFPDEPILVVIDYLQIVPGTEKDMRARVAETAQAVRRMAKRLKVVALAISQPSRAAGKALSAGELLGAESMTAMAESAEIERAAYITLALGSSGPERADGSKAVDLNVGKGRFGGGDRVIPVAFEGRTGRMRIDGESKPASEVREQRTNEKERKRVQTAMIAIVSIAEKSKKSLTRSELSEQSAVRKTVALAAVRAAIKTGELVEVQQKESGRKDWKVWTRERAVAAGVAIIEVASCA